VTLSATATLLQVQAFNSTDLDITAVNPVDAHLFAQGTLTSCSGGFCFAAGNITVAVAHDVIALGTEGARNDNFYPTNPANTHGSVALTVEGFGGAQTGNLAGSSAFWNVTCAAGCGTTPVYGLVDSGAAGTYAVNIKFANINFYANISASVVAYKGLPAAGGRVRHRVIQDKYRVPRHRERILLGAILSIWLRRKKLTANECWRGKGPPFSENRGFADRCAVTRVHPRNKTFAPFCLFLE
jgi:hypothetical protein